MTTRTELIAELRSYEWDDEKQVTMALNAADMLKADGKEQRRLYWR